MSARRSSAPPTDIARAIEAVRALATADAGGALAACERHLATWAALDPAPLRPLRVLRMNLLRRLTKFDEADALARALIAELDAAGSEPSPNDSTEDFEALAWAWSTLTASALVCGQLEAAFENAERGLELVRGSGSGAEAALLSQRGSAHFELKQLEEASRSFHAAQVVYRELNDLDGLSLSLTNLGNVSRLSGHLDEALECYERARTIAGDHGLQFAFALAEHNLAECLQHLGRDEEALATSQRVLELDVVRDNRQIQHGALITGAHALRRLARPREAGALAHRALDVARDMRSGTAEAEALAELGNAALDDGQLEDASVSFSSGLRVAQRLESPRWEALLLSGLLRLAGRRQAGFEVVSGVQEMLDRASSGVQDQPLLAELHLTASEVYEGLGEPARALEHLRAHMAAQEQIRRPRSEAESAPLTEGVRRELERLAAERESELLATRGVLVEAAADRDRLSRARGSLADQLKHAQKMEAVGRLASGIAHDFNNVLTIVCGYSELFAAGESDPARREHVAEILRAAERGAEMTQKLLTFSQRPPGTPGSIELRQVIESSRGPLERLLGDGVALLIEAAPTPAVAVDRGDLEQILMNLALNGRDAMPDGGTLTITSFASDADGDVGLRVRDTGMGIDPNMLERVFEPFFTTKAPDAGTGLGLSTVYGIVTGNGGTVRVRSRPGEGATFEVRLPRAQEETQATTAVAADQVRHAGPLRVLLVEDDDSVRALVRSLLEGDGHSVLTASDGLEALAAFREKTNAFDLVITDLVLPFLSGEQLYESLASESPTVPFLFTSGHPRRRHDRDGDNAFLPKPFSTSELRECVARLTGGGQPARTSQA